MPFCTKTSVLTLLLINYTHVLGSEPSNACTTPVCQTAKSTILNMIDPSVNPCDDFYKFTCGGLFKKTLHGKPASLDALVQDEVDNQIKTMLTDPIKPTEPKAVQGIKKFFVACMDEATIEKDGLNSLKEILKQAGGWPIVEGSKWSEDNFDLLETLVRLRRMGLTYDQIYRFWIINKEIVDIRNPTEWMTEDAAKGQLHDFITGVAILLGADAETARQETDQIIKFRSKLTEIIAHELFQASNENTFKALQEQFPSTNWLKLVNDIRNPNEEVSVNDKIYCPSSQYLSGIENLLKTTPSRIIADYVIWNAIEEAIPYLPKAFSDLDPFKDNSTKENNSRFKICQKVAQEILPPTVETLYVHNYFSLRRKNSILDVMGLFQEEFVQLLNETDMYDEETKINTIAKTKSIKSLIGGPEELFHIERLREIFDSDENLNTTDFLKLATILNRQRNTYKLKFNATLQNDEYHHSIMLNGQYDGLANAMVISAALMQGQYFNEDQPQFMNFGTLGLVVGHELTHAFGEEQITSDNLWTKTSKDRYHKKIECLIEQADKFNIQGTDLHMNGSRIIEEAMCDQNGVELAHRVYEDWVKAHGEEKQLAGLSYTPKQLFWVSAASFFCHIVPPEDLKTDIEEDLHPHPEFRIFNAFSNNKHFGKDFNCPVGSRMNPVEKCHIF